MLKQSNTTVIPLSSEHKALIREAIEKSKGREIYCRLHEEAKKTLQAFKIVKK